MPNIDERMANEVSAVIYKAGEVKKVAGIEDGKKSATSCVLSQRNL